MVRIKEDDDLIEEDELFNDEFNESENEEQLDDFKEEPQNENLLSEDEIKELIEKDMPLENISFGELDNIKSEEIIEKKEEVKEDDFKVDTEKIDRFTTATDDERNAIYDSLGPNGETLRKLKLTNEEYRQLKDEVQKFIVKKRDKKFMIFAIGYTPTLIVVEFIYKVYPIINYILVRNKHPELSKKLYEIIKDIDIAKLYHYLEIINSDYDYGKNIIEYKLNRELTKSGDKIKAINMLFYVVQPSKARSVPASTVGVSKQYFDELTEENE